MNRILIGDALEKLAELPSQSVHCCVTSPPYWSLRNYGVDGQIGLEADPFQFLDKLVDVFREVRRVLRDDGTLWVNMGDTYASGGRGGGGSFMKERGHAAWKGRESINGWRSPPKGWKHKEIMGIPWRLAFSLQGDDWILRQDIVWHKPSGIPESVVDRCTKSHEYIFLLTKQAKKYYFDAEAIKEESEDWPAMKNKRSVWTVANPGIQGAHFATYPLELIEPCILAGCPKGGVVLDPFFGSGTTGLAAMKHGRSIIGIELNPEYAKLAEERLKYGTTDTEEMSEMKKQETLFPIDIEAAE